VCRRCHFHGEQISAGRVRAAGRGQNLVGHLPEPLGEAVGVRTVRQDRSPGCHVCPREVQHGASDARKSHHPLAHHQQNGNIFIFKLIFIP